MLTIDSINDQNDLLIINKTSILLLKLSNSLEKIAFNHSAEITACNFLPTKHILILADVTKRCFLIDIKNQNHIISTKEVNKRVVKILFTKDECSIVVGDKTGDVYLLNIEQDALENSEFKLIMGHLSMLTDLSLSFDKKYLFTSDRDEKIRISLFPNSYNIQSYLLAHKEFVIQIQQINKQRLISASGDSKLILWNMEEAKPLQIISVLDLIQSEDKATLQNLKGINKFDFDEVKKILLLHLFRSTFLLEFSYDEANMFTFIRKIDMNEQIDGFVRLKHDFYIFLALNDSSSDKLFIKKYQNGKLESLNNENSNGLERLNTILSENINIDNPKKMRDEFETNYLAFFKANVDNLGDYYEKKKERIEGVTSTKRKRTTSKTDSVSSDLPPSK